MMMYENDKYEIPKEVLQMPKEQLKKELEKARIEMNSHPNKRPKAVLKRKIKFNF